MEKITENPFLTDWLGLTVIETDLREPEALMQSLASEAEREQPKAFAGRESCVYLRLRYVPPYGSFEELRRLILRLREAAGLRADYRGVVALEATSWLGHEQEEYFIVLLKYLYDHNAHWRTAMILQEHTPAAIRRFLTACAAYITPRHVLLRVFSDRKWLSRVLQESFERRGYILQPDARALLVEEMNRGELEKVRGTALLSRITRELICSADDHRRITREQMERYLDDPIWTPSMLAGGRMQEQRRGRPDHEAVLL